MLIIFKATALCKLKELNNYIYQTVYDTKDITNHKLITYFFDTESRLLNYSVYIQEHGTVNRSLLGKPKVTSVENLMMVNYITIALDAASIKCELNEIREQVKSGLFSYLE